MKKRGRPAMPEADKALRKKTKLAYLARKLRKKKEKERERDIENIAFLGTLLFEMKRNRITQQALAEYLGVSRSLISQWKNGWVFIPVHHIEGIKKFYDQLMDDLGREDEMT